MTTTIEPTHFGLFERIAFPNGTEIYYNDERHSYWRGVKPKADGSFGGTGRLTGVSTLVGPYDFRPDNLMRWVERLTLDGVVRGFNGQQVPSDPHMLRQMLQTRGLRWEQIRDEAGARGTNVHRTMLEALALGDEVPDLSDLPEDQRGYGQAVMKWWLDREPEVTHVEQVVASHQHGFAGRLDLRCRIKDPLRQGHGVVDLKTGSFIAAKDMVQPSGYDLGGLESGLWDEPADWLLIVQVNDRGDYREVWSPAQHEDFLAALRLYRRSAEFAKVAKAA